MAKKNTKQKDQNPSIGNRAGSFFKSVKTELQRVTWPTRKEVINYTIVVIVTLIFFGFFIYLLDSIILPLFVGFSGLRGLF